MFGGPGAWDNADKAQIQCPKEGCGGEEAAFFQVQIRSADEPMTSFYKVTSGSPRCQSGANWKTVHGLRKSMERELRVDHWSASWAEFGNGDKEGCMHWRNFCLFILRFSEVYLGFPLGYIVAF